MSWEVLTMRSATSFFNGAIARSDLRRYWPVLFLYVGLWLIFLPIPVWNRAAERNPALVNLTELCADTYATAVVLALIFGGMMAMASFSYLMTPRSVGAMHALPQRRGTLFWTHFLTGWAMLAAGNLLVLAVTALAALLGGLALTPALLTWFVVATLLDLIFLALGTLCAMVTGWLLAVPVLYAAVNCLAVALTWLGQQLAELLLDGFTMPDAQPVITRWLTPVYQLICDLGQSGPSYSPFLTGKLPDDRIQNADCASGLAPQGWRTLLIFTAVALVLTVLSRLLYGRRKSELSGDAAAFPWMRPVFRLGVGLVGGLPLGMLLYVLVSVGRSGDFSPARLCVCMAVMGIVCYLAAAMLVGKTLRVLPKRLPGAAVTALVLVLLCVALRADVFGYADRTPQAEDVARARVYCLDTSFTLEDPRSLETLVKAQAELAENRAADVNCRMTFVVHYVLKDGTSMARCYRLAMTEPVKAALEQVARLGEVGNLVLLIPVLAQQLHGVEVHIRLQVPVRQAQALPPVIQRRPLLQLQPVAGDVPGGQHQGVGQGVFPLLQGLVRQTVDQVQADVVQPGLAAGGHGVLHLLPGVNPAQPPQGLVIRGLHPQGDAVEARPAQGPQSPPVPGAVGVGLQGDLRPVPDPALLLHGFQQGNKPLVAQIAGGAAAEIDGVHPVVLHLGGHLGDVPGQGRGIGVHLLLAMGQGVKIAIGALGLAEGNVQIQAQGAVAVDHRLFHISSPWAAGWSPRQTDS